MLVKRPFGKILAAAAINITTGQFYAVSVSTKTTWAKNSPSSTDFTVYVDGIKKLSFTDTDAPYFSGRFGVNASYANARFICLQATSPEAPALPPCVPRPHLPAPIPLAH
jgi:hypothetical protein